MYVETIFSETLDGAESLYWYSIQGRGGTEVRDSGHWIDRKHLEYWDECIDPEFAPQTPTTRVSMIPQRILEQMQQPSRRTARARRTLRRMRGGASCGLCAAPRS